MLGWGWIDARVGIVESSVFLSNVLADIFNGESVGEGGVWKGWLYSVML